MLVVVPTILKKCYCLTNVAILRKIWTIKHDDKWKQSHTSFISQKKKIVSSKRKTGILKIWRNKRFKIWTTYIVCLALVFIKVCLVSYTLLFIIYHHSCSTIIAADIYEEISIHQYKWVVMAIHIFFRSVIFNIEDAYKLQLCCEGVLFIYRHYNNMNLWNIGPSLLKKISRVVKMCSCVVRGWTKTGMKKGLIMYLTLL